MDTILSCNEKTHNFHSNIYLYLKKNTVHSNHKYIIILFQLCIQRGARRKIERSEGKEGLKRNQTRKKNIKGKTFVWLFFLNAFRLNIPLSYFNRCIPYSRKKIYF